MLSFTQKEKVLLRKLDTPEKTQDFLNGLRFNFEKKGETVKSPAMVLRTKNAHCIEGAILGAYLLSLRGYPPLILHLQTTEEDFDHVVAVFKRRGFWGALSKTNHAVLRYRDPVYKNIRELAMSYFNEYFLDKGQKTLREYSQPLNLNAFGKSWVLEESDLWKIDRKLDEIKHYSIAPRVVLKNLRKADKIERKAGKITEYKD